MALPILHWNQGPDIDTLEILLASLIDAAQAPDTIFQEHSVASLERIFWELSSREWAELDFYERRILLLLTENPSLWSFVDTAEAPDTIFQEFFSLSKVHIPVFPDATLIDPGVTVFAGDMGLYIG